MTEAATARRPSEALAAHLDEVRAIIARYPVSNPRVFGSVARGEDKPGSDLDLLIHPEEGLTYYELGQMSLELEQALGVKVDLGEDTCLRSHAAFGAATDAKPI